MIGVVNLLIGLSLGCLIGFFIGVFMVIHAIEQGKTDYVKKPKEASDGEESD